MLNNLPLDFFDEEIRYDYVITNKQKRIWAVQLDLLARYALVCEQNGLQYFLNGGTLLGAVRHKGFIPWDDDVDVMMLRQDYDKLCAIAPSVFKEPYFFQTALTESGLFRAHAQLRNSNTTGYIEADRDKDINKGIFLDIFVIDNIPDMPLHRSVHKSILNTAKRVLRLAYDTKTDNKSVMQLAIIRLYRASLHIIPFSAQYRFFEQRIMARYSNRSTALVGDLTMEWREAVHWKREWFSGYQYCDFETLKLRIPSGYHEILSKQYGDYLKIPSVTNLPSSVHGQGYWDPDVPYYIHK